MIYRFLILFDTNILLDITYYLLLYNSFKHLGYSPFVKTSNRGEWKVYHAFSLDQIKREPGRTLCIDKVHWTIIDKLAFIGPASTTLTLAPIKLLD